MAFSVRDKYLTKGLISIKFAIITLVCISCWFGHVGKAVHIDSENSESIQCKEEEEEKQVGILEDVYPDMGTLRQSVISAQNTHQEVTLNPSLAQDKEHGSLVNALKNPNSEKTVVSVESFGANGDGTVDDTQAFLSAWKTACSIPNSVFLVPEGKRYLVKPMKFVGPCKDGNLIVQIEGTIVAPDDPSAWDPHSLKNWLVFDKLKGLTIQGGGVIDGSGKKWWEQSCKINKANPCRSAPTVLTIHSSSNVRLRDLRFQNSQQMHIAVSRSIGVQVTNLQVVAPGNSPNTDGIHITASQNIQINECSIATGDDCISIVSGSANIRIKNVVCGPGHGISIGSLGEGDSEAYVSGVVVDGAMLTGTMNGLRIKTWQGGSGFARGFRFQNIKMNDVSNPIIIDQFYCDSPKSCKNQTSAVRVSEVVYVNISGTSKTPQAIKFACSDTVPCENIILANIDLRRDTGDAADYFCNNAVGFRLGSVNPSADCLQKYDGNKPGHDHHPINNIQGQNLTSQDEQMLIDLNIFPSIH